MLIVIRRMTTTTTAAAAATTTAAAAAAAASYLTICVSHPFIHPSICSCCSHLAHKRYVKRFVSLQFFLNFRQSVRLLGRGISTTQGRYLHRATQTQNKRRQTSIHVLSVIRIHDHSGRAASDRAATVIGSTTITI
jgi:hypothetical protein